MIRVIDNFIPLSYQKELYDVLSSRNFLWTYQPCTIDGYTTNDENVSDVPFLGLRVDNNSPLFSLMKPLQYFFIDNINRDCKIHRTKINCHLPKDDDRWHPPHTDSRESGIYTLLYYVNDSDGNTIIFNETNDKNGLTINRCVEPKMGRALIFPANQFHCGNNPRNDRRITINMLLRT